MLKIKTIIRHSENDNWENGCSIDGSQTDFPEWDRPEFETPSELIHWIKQRTGADSECFTFDACEEVGRIDVQFNAITHGAKRATSAQIDAWKNGTRTMRLVDVSFYIEETVVPKTTDWQA